MIILDTDAVSELMRPRPSPTLLAKLDETPVDLQATTAITVGELAYGAHKAKRPELFDRAMTLLTGVHIFDFDESAAGRYGWLRAYLEGAGTPLADPDLRIAAIALAGAATLVTGNVAHLERVPGLDVEDWIRGGT